MSQTPKSNEITPPAVYFNRRTLLKTGLVGATALATGALYRRINGQPTATVEGVALAGLQSATTGGPTTAGSGDASPASPVMASGNGSAAPFVDERTFSGA